MKPEELLYAQSHEWASISDDGGEKVATVGLSSHAIEALTDLVYMELPTKGDVVTAGESFGEVESVKATSDLYSPVTGEVVAVNSDLLTQLETLGEDPYGEGWIIKVKLADGNAVADLMDFEAYEKQCGEG